MPDFSDRKWAREIRAKVAAKQRQHPVVGPLQFKAPIEWVKMLDIAALNRGVNRSSYVRRALSVAMAHDLGVSVRPLLAMLPTPKGPRENNRALDGLADDGTGIEQWCPCPACPRDH